MLDLGTLQLGIKVNGDEAKSELNKVSGEVEKTGLKTQELAAKAKTMIKAFVAAHAVKELVKLGKAALDSYAKFEQLEGGVQKIFGKEAAQEVMKNANEAYKTAGMSANSYMETVTNFSASLIQSMGGNTKAAAQVADMAIRDMSDNANTFGTNMQSIQDAYQGFAKQNYTMLDNLKLGYGGTKTEMERLLSDAEKLTGKKYDISNLNDVYEAIHAIQEEYNITGTTSKEASKTIEGSMNMTKASWENFLTSLGSGKGVTQAMDNLFTSLGTTIKNIAPVALKIVVGLAKAMVQAVPKAIGMLGQFMSKLAQGLDKGGQGNMAATAFNLIKTLVTGMIKAIPQFASGIISLVLSLAKYLVTNAAQFIETGKQFLTNLVTGFLEGHPKIQNAAKAIINIAFKPLEKTIKAVTKVIKTLHSWWKKLLGQKGSKKYKVDAPFSKAIQSIKDVFGKWKDVLGQKAKKTFTVIKSGFKGVLDGMKSIYNKWKDILSQKSTKHFSITSSGKVPSGGKGHHRIGLREVPYDGYEAILHKGEAVMTAAEVNKLKKQGESTTTSKGDLTVNVYGSNNMNVTELAAAVERKIIQTQKRRSAAWV